MNIGEYIDKANEAIMIIVQVETLLGLENAEAIARVPGVGKSNLCIISPCLC